MSFEVKDAQVEGLQVFDAGNYDLVGHDGLRVDMSGGRSAANVLATARTRVASHSLPPRSTPHHYQVSAEEAAAAVAASIANGATVLERADALRAQLYGPAAAAGALATAELAQAA